MSSDDSPEFGVTDQGRGFFTVHESRWHDIELAAGLKQIERRVRELDELRDRLTAEQVRRKELYADVAAVFTEGGQA